MREEDHLISFHYQQFRVQNQSYKVREINKRKDKNTII
jgi:hypothetical protein